VKQFIKSDLAEEGELPFRLSCEKKPKPIFDFVDLQILLQYLWCRDTHVYPNERYRVQTALILLLSSYAGLRPGSVMESVCHRGTNELPKYKVLLRPIKWLMVD